MRYWPVLLSMLFSTTVWSQTNVDAYALGVDGVKLVDEGRYDEGIKLLKQAHFLAPSDYDFSFELGKAYLQSGDAKKAEKQLFQLQYHVNVQADLYVLLANCYARLEELKKTPDESRKKELDALRYGIQKLPSQGILYLELGRRNVEMERSVEALATLESGIRYAPNFAENYYWAAKLMNASSDQFWAWIYAETCFNMTDDIELQRSSARIIDQSLKNISEGRWKPEPNKMETELQFLVSSKCPEPVDQSVNQLALFRNCLLANWNTSSYSFNPLFTRLKQLQESGWLESYLASQKQETDKPSFLTWLVDHTKEFETYSSWRYWNPMQLKEPVIRIQNN